MAKPAPISNTEFLAKGKAIPVHFGNPGEPGTFTLWLSPEKFSTGSVGFKYNGKNTIIVDGKPISFQIGMNVTMIGSKNAPDAAPFVKPSEKGSASGGEDPALAAALTAAAAAVEK